MSDWHDLIRHLLGRFGRPDTLPRATDENMDALDGRLTDVEERQREIAARLALLEIASNPRGRPSRG